MLKYFSQNRGFLKWRLQAGSYVQRQLSVACASSSFCCLLLHIFSNFISLCDYKQDLVSTRDLAIGHNHFVWLGNFLRQWIPQIGFSLQKIVFLLKISKFTALSFYWILYSSWLMPLCERLYTSLYNTWSTWLVY